MDDDDGNIDMLVDKDLNHPYFDNTFSHKTFTQEERGTGFKFE